MEKEVILGGKRIHLKYENGIVSFRQPKDIGWVTCQNDPDYDLNEDEIMEIARICLKGLGLIR